MSRKLICGAGINDADYPVTRNKKVNGKYKQIWCCPFYIVWLDMIKRCYSSKVQERKPTYKGCAVCDSWLSFLSFKSWMVKQDWKDKQLDKDIVSIGNQIYSPDNCVFVTRQVNTLLLSHKAARGKYRQGVSLHKTSNKFQSKCRVNGKAKHLGLFETEYEAYATYVAFKARHIREIADSQSKRIRDGLYRHADLLESTVAY